MNHLHDVRSLRNRYYVMRHGQSKANVLGIIVSHPQNGVLADYALSEIGRRQAYDSATSTNLAEDVLIYTSDFSRAFETAEIARQVFGSSEVQISVALRERNFGDLEKRDNSNYERVWAADKQSASHNVDNVESVSSVLDRATRFIMSLERLHSGKSILLVSHGDTLQILQTGFEKVDPTAHRSLRHLETAEIRELSLSVDKQPGRRTGR